MPFIESDILIRANGNALSTLLTELGGLNVFPIVLRPVSELLDLRVPENGLEEGSHVLPTTHSSVYSFRGLCYKCYGALVPL